MNPIVVLLIVTGALMIGSRGLGAITNFIGNNAVPIFIIAVLLLIAAGG